MGDKNRLGTSVLCVVSANDGKFDFLMGNREGQLLPNQPA